MCTPQWGIAFFSNSMSRRARKWYRVTRLVHADGKLFELYWHADDSLRGASLAKVRANARNAGLALLPGIYTDAPAPRHGAEMIRVDASART